MKNWKKLLSIFCAVIMSVSVFAIGCSGGATGGDDEEDYVITEKDRTYTYKGQNIMNNLGSATGEISFAVGGDTSEYQIWSDLIADFQNKNPGITVKKNTINNFDVLYQQLAAGTAPDVIQIDSSYFGNWAKNGALQSIQPLVERDSYSTSDFWPQLIQMFSFNTSNGVRGNGDLFALPKDMGIPGIFVNRTLIDNAKNQGRITQAEYNLVTDQVHPMTFDQYLTIAKKLTNYTGDTATSVYGTNRIYWESYLWSLGDDILTSKYELNTASANLKKVMEYSKAMVTAGGADFCAPYTSAAATSSAANDNDRFISGKLAMFWAGRWNVSSFDKANMTTYYCIPLPVAEKADGTKGESITWCATVGYGISRNCKKGEMAWKLIKYLASADAYRIMNNLNYNVPGRKSLITENAFKNPTPQAGCTHTIDAASQKVFFDLAPVARINNASRLSSDAWIDNFESKLDLYFTNQIQTFEQLMQKCKKSVNNAIKKSDPQLF